MVECGDGGAFDITSYRDMLIFFCARLLHSRQARRSNRRAYSLYQAKVMARVNYCLNQNAGLSSAYPLIFDPYQSSGIINHHITRRFLKRGGTFSQNGVT